MNLSEMIRDTVRRQAEHLDQLAIQGIGYGCGVAVLMGQLTDDFDLVMYLSPEVPLGSIYHYSLGATPPERLAL